MTNAPFGTFFLPGPTEVRPAVLQAMLQPMIAHRGAAFEALFARLQHGLRHVFRTARPVYVSSSSATGLMEAAVRGAPPGPVLSVVNGAFADRFRHIAVACAREVDVLAVLPGATVALDALGARLAARRYAAVTVVHSETSTGALTDVRRVSDLAHAHGALCLVDSVTGVGGTPLEFDAWELDFALTGSQKALAMPPGLAFAVASERYLATVTAAPARGVYFDVAEFERFVHRNQTPNTPAISLLYAAEAQLDAIIADGIERRWERHRLMAERTWRWVDDTARATSLPMRVLAADGARTPTVTAIELPPHIAAALPKAMARRGYVIGGGYGAVKETTVRIGHMGDHTVDTLDGCLAVCREALEDVA
jgi:aspartate aminotransferase-like enzyme